jgi:hypothetical protein
LSELVSRFGALAAVVVVGLEVDAGAYVAVA